MSYSKLKPQDIQIFSDAAIAFFTQTTGRPANVRTAYLSVESTVAKSNCFYGCIDLSGKFKGSVVFTAPRDLLTHLLIGIGEQDYSDSSHLDIVGEITNQIAGFARRHFGAGMQISPPSTSFAMVAQPKGDDDLQNFSIPVQWEYHEAHLLVSMKAC